MKLLALRSRADAIKGAQLLTYWFDLGQSLAMLALESHEVIGLRVSKLSVGGFGAVTEAQLMMTEKARAAAEAVIAIAVGSSPQSIVTAYRDKVQANRTRLADTQIADA